jgi:hypothetical protein
VEGQDQSSQLEFNVIRGFAHSGTLITGLAPLLALQTGDNVVGIGHIDAPIRGADIRFDRFNGTILHALDRMQKQLPSYKAGTWFIYDNKIHWYTSIENAGTDTEFAVGEKLQGHTVEYDYEQLRTRVYAYGRGRDPDTQLSLIDAGEANEYVENNTGTYGVRSVIIETEVDLASVLLQWANRVLDELSTLPLNVTVDVLDLAKIQSNAGRTGGGWDSDWEDVFAGKKYTVTDSDMGISEEVQVVSVAYDFSNPLPITVELANRTKKVGQVIADIVEMLNKPVIVDGDDYPRMGRNYSAAVTADNLRTGDLRYNTGTGQLEAYNTDTEEWDPVGRPLSEDDPQPVTTVLGNVTAGDSEEGSPINHVHLVGTGGTVQNVGYTSGNGSGDNLARANHNHKGVKNGGRVNSLPVIPTATDALLIVEWTSDGAGDGDDQPWITWKGASEYSPLGFTTTKSGIP